MKSKKKKKPMVFSRIQIEIQSIEVNDISFRNNMLLWFPTSARLRTVPSYQWYWSGTDQSGHDGNNNIIAILGFLWMHYYNFISHLKWSFSSTMTEGAASILVPFHYLVSYTHLDIGHLVTIWQLRWIG